MQSVNSDPQTDVPLLEARGLRKHYAGVVALDGVDLTLMPGQIHALVGDNGAGKSTLMKILAGAVSPTAGEIRLRGEPVRFHSPRDAQAAGIETVYQDLALAKTLSPSANVFLGREISRRGLAGGLGLLNKKKMTSLAKATLESVGAEFADAREVGALSGGQMQAVAIARAVHWTSSVVMLDEPTAALGVRQRALVHDTIKRVRDVRGAAVILISHNLPEVYAVADAVTVLRRGQSVLTSPIADLTHDQLLSAMSGLAFGSKGTV